MSTLTLYHNPRCSKSRRALELLTEKGVELDVVEYLENPPSRTVLENLVAGADVEPAEFVRTGDAAFKEAGLSLSADANAAEVIELLCDHPAVMQRPVVAGGGRVVIGRPPELVLDLVEAT